MSEFLMVIPPDWNELPNATDFVALHGDAQLMELISSGQIGTVDAMLESEGVIPTGKTTDQVRLFRDGDQWRLWFTLIDIPQ